LGAVGAPWGPMGGLWGPHGAPWGAVGAVWGMQLLVSRVFARIFVIISILAFSDDFHDFCQLFRKQTYTTPSLAEWEGRANPWSERTCRARSLDFPIFPPSAQRVTQYRLNIDETVHSISKHNTIRPMVHGTTSNIHPSLRTPVPSGGRCSVDITPSLACYAHSEPQVVIAWVLCSWRFEVQVFARSRAITRRPSGPRAASPPP